MPQSPSMIQTQRTNMILRQIRPWFVHDEEILNLLYFLPREDFFPDELKKFAFVDMEIKLDQGRYTHPPKLEGKILNFLGLNGEKKVLEIGTINGYLTAAISKMAQSVKSIEQDDELYQRAQSNLESFTNVELEQKNLKVSIEKLASADEIFDVIVINQPISEFQQSWLNSLADGGKLFCFEGSNEYMRALLVEKKQAEGQVCIDKNPLFEFNLRAEVITTGEKKFRF